MAPTHSLTVAELAREEGISTATLYNWRKAARERGAVLPSNSAATDKWSSCQHHMDHDWLKARIKSPEGDYTKPDSGSPLGGVTPGVV